MNGTLAGNFGYGHPGGAKREPGDGDALRAAAQKLEEAGGKIMFADAPVLECAPAISAQESIPLPG